MTSKTYTSKNKRGDLMVEVTYETRGTASRILWLAVSFVFLTRASEMFTEPVASAHPFCCCCFLRTGDISFYKELSQLGVAACSNTDQVELSFTGSGGNQFRKSAVENNVRSGLPTRLKHGRGGGFDGRIDTKVCADD